MGRGRPAKEKSDDRVVTAMRLPRELLKELKVTAIVRETSVNDIVIEAARAWLEREGARVVERTS